MSTESSWTPWITAKASGSQGNCVQMRTDGEVIQVGDSKDPDGPVLTYTKAEIVAWLDGAKKGEFDGLAH